MVLNPLAEVDIAREFFSINGPQESAQNGDRAAALDAERHVFRAVAEVGAVPVDHSYMKEG